MIRAIRDDNAFTASANRGGGFFAELIKASLERTGGATSGVSRGDRLCLEFRVALDVLQFRIEEDRRVKHDRRRFLALSVEQVALRAEGHGQRHDEAFTKRIDRRVRDLGETLLEVIVQQARTARQDRHRSVITHGPGRLDGV